MLEAHYSYEEWEDDSSPVMCVCRLVTMVETRSRRNFSVPSSVESTIPILVYFSSPSGIKSYETSGSMIKKSISEGHALFSTSCREDPVLRLFHVS